MNRSCSMFLATLLALAAAGPASAQITYEFFNNTIPNGGTAQAAFSVPLNGTVPIYVYIHDTATNAGNPSGGATFASDGGLSGAAVRVTDGNAAIAAVILAGPSNNPTNPLPALPPWGFGTDNGSNALSSVLNDSTSLSAVTGVAGDTNGRIFLGTFTFKGLATGSMTITGADPNPGSSGDVLSFNSFNSYDNLLQPGTANLTVTGVPEPGTLALVGLAATGLGAWRRRTAPTAAA